MIRSIPLHRRPRHRRLALLLGVAAVASASLVSTAGPAAAVTCSGYGCDRQNPYGSGCQTGSVVKYDVPLGMGPRVRLHYSAACRTVWASIYDVPSGWQSYADVHRNSDGLELYCYPGSYSSCYTNMLYDGGVTSHAYGWVSFGSGGTEAVATPDY